MSGSSSEVWPKTNLLEFATKFIPEIDPISKEVVWNYENEGYANLKFFSKTMGSHG